MVRIPVAAGSFYSADKTELESKIKELFGEIKLKKAKKSRIVISPHAGYAYSGLLTAESINCLEKSNLFIILGTNHTYSGTAEFLFSLEDFQTPFGVVKNETKISQEISKNAEDYGLNIEINESTHSLEHSIEVQLPFLQCLFKKIKIIPIIVNTKNTKSLEKFTGILIKLIKKHNISIIASSDFTHFGKNYGFTPFSSNIKENLYKLDKSAISEILKMNVKGFLEKSSKTTICGSAPIALGIEVAKKLGCKKAELIDYKTSGDVSGDYSNAVGYASIIFN